MVVCARKQAVVNTIKDQAASADVAENKHLRARALNERAERICCGCLEVYVAVLLPWCNGQDVMSPSPLRSPHNVHQRSLCLCSSVKHIPRFRSSVCRADEPSPRGAGRAGCHGLQVRADRGKAAILLSGGPTVLCDQAAHQLSLQGDGGHTRGDAPGFARLYLLKFGFMRKSPDTIKYYSRIVLLHVKTVRVILTPPWAFPGARAAVPEAVIVAAVLFSAHQTAGARLESAASHGASDLGGRRDRRGPPAHQDRLCSARAGQRSQIHQL